jgi:signal transduction histidine kinase
VTENQSALGRFRYGIGTKIIIPFLLLTLIIAGAGTYLLTTFITDSLNERLTNRLVDAGRVVSERLVNFEEDRLETLRVISNTQGVGELLAEGDSLTIQDKVIPFVINAGADAVEFLDMDGMEVFGWQHIPGSEPFIRNGSDFSEYEAVQFVLDGRVDESGDKTVMLTKTPDGEHILFTIGPVFLPDGEQVGAAMVGTILRPMALELTENAVARVTFYDKNGTVIETTLSSGDELPTVDIEQDSEELSIIQSQLALSPERFEIVRTQTSQEVPIADRTVLGQDYSLAYGDWRLRDQSFGLFSVAVPTDFLTIVRDTGRNSFLLLFALASAGALLIGLLLARSITNPLNRLVETATAVGEGDLGRRTGIESKDEIGQLATSFDLMTGRLAHRNDQLLKQTTELETILNSITDGVVLLDNEDNIISANLAAQQLLADLSYDFLAAGPFRELRGSTNVNSDQDPSTTEPESQTEDAPSHPMMKRYQIGDRTLTTLASEVETEEGVHLGTVIVMRDITREVESENLKDAFITSISHELRTPLTVIKVYGDLMEKTGNGQLNDRQVEFIRNINRGTKQLETHINQLINISEIQAGTIQVNLENVDIVELVRAATDNWENRFAAKDIDLVVGLFDSPLFISGDKTQLEWAIESLLSNAHNYTGAGGQVEITVTDFGNQVKLSVADNGIGIAVADQSQLFNRFFRAQNSLNYETRGVGLGLFIARSVVESHHGEISVESELGKGSTFSVILPLAVGVS